MFEKSVLETYLTYDADQAYEDHQAYEAYQAYQAHQAYQAYQAYQAHQAYEAHQNFPIIEDCYLGLDNQGMILFHFSLKKSFLLSSTVQSPNICFESSQTSLLVLLLYME